MSEVVSIVREVITKFLGNGRPCDKVMASSNSAARVVGGDTVHSSCHLHARVAFTLERMAALEGTGEFVDEWRDVDALILDETSMVSPALLGALSYRACRARERTRGVDPDLYTEPGHMFGGVLDRLVKRS